MAFSKWVCGELISLLYRNLLRSGLAGLAGIIGGLLFRRCLGSGAGPSSRHRACRRPSAAPFRSLSRCRGQRPRRGGSSSCCWRSPLGSCCRAASFSLCGAWLPPPKPCGAWRDSVNKYLWTPRLPFRSAPTPRRPWRATSWFSLWDNINCADSRRLWKSTNWPAAQIDPSVNP